MSHWNDDEVHVVTFTSDDDVDDNGWLVGFLAFNLWRNINDTGSFLVQIQCMLNYFSFHIFTNNLRWIRARAKRSNGFFFTERIGIQSRLWHARSWKWGTVAVIRFCVYVTGHNENGWDPRLHPIHSPMGACRVGKWQPMTISLLGVMESVSGLVLY